MTNKTFGGGAFGATEFGGEARTIPRSATSAGIGASTTARTAQYARVSASAQSGESIATRVVRYDRASATIQTGASSTARVAQYTRTTTSVADAGVSQAARVLALNRSAASQGQRGASNVARAFADFAIEPRSDDPSMLRPRADLELTPSTLSLSWRDETDAWFRFDESGDFSVTEQYGGGFRAQRRDGGTPVRVEPPLAVRPVIEIGEWVPADFTTSEVITGLRDYELSLQRPVPRRGAETELVAEAGVFTLTFEANGFTASLGLSDEQVLLSEASASATGRETTLPLLLSNAELATLGAVCDRPAAVVERSVPDGDSRRVDSSAESRHTVTLSAPADASVASGTYLIGAWSASPADRGPETWRVELPLFEAP